MLPQEERGLVGKHQQKNNPKLAHQGKVVESVVLIYLKMVTGLRQRQRNMTTYVIPAIKYLLASARVQKTLSLIVQDVEKS